MFTLLTILWPSFWLRSMAPSTSRTNCVSNVTEIGSEGDRGEGDNASCIWKRPRLAKGIGSKCENDWHKRITERKRIQVLMLQERNFFLIFIHFKQCVLYLYDYKTRLFYTDSETKLASFLFPRFLLQEVHLIFPRFLWVCTRLPPYKMALCECNRKTALSTFQFPFSITRIECLFWTV